MVVLTGTSVFRPILGVFWGRVQDVKMVFFVNFDDFDENRRNHQNRVWVSGHF